MKKIKQKDELVTKEYLELRLDKHTASIIKYIDHRLEPFEEMRKDYYEFKDSVLKSLDWLVGAFKKFNEEHTILMGTYTEVNTKLDNHKTRITVLENKSNC